MSMSAIRHALHHITSMVELMGVELRGEHVVLALSGVGKLAGLGQSLQRIQVSSMYHDAIECSAPRSVVGQKIHAAAPQSVICGS